MDFHERGVQKLFQTLVDKGDIYKGEYRGWYCVSDENFLADDVPLDGDGCKDLPGLRQEGDRRLRGDLLLPSLCLPG